MYTVTAALPKLQTEIIKFRHSLFYNTTLYNLLKLLVNVICMQRLFVHKLVLKPQTENNQ